MGIFSKPGAGGGGAAAVVSYPKRVIMSIGTDTDHDIDFAAGRVPNEDGDLLIIAGALTKRADATFATGTGNGGMADGESLPTSGTVHCFVLSNADASGTDFGFDTDVAAVNLLADSAVVAAGLDEFKRIGSLRTDSSANFIGFTQYGNKFMHDDKKEDIVDLFLTSSSGLSSLTVPSDIKVKAHVYLSLVAAGTGTVEWAIVHSPDELDVALTLNNAGNLVARQPTSGVAIIAQHETEIVTDTSGRVRHRGKTSVNAFLYIHTLGYVDFGI